VALIRQGLTNRQISVDLGVTLKTVKNQINRLYRKTGIASRHQVMTSIVILAIGKADQG